MYARQKLDVEDQQVRCSEQQAWAVLTLKAARLHTKSMGGHNLTITLTSPQDLSYVRCVRDFSLKAASLTLWRQAGQYSRTQQSMLACLKLHANQDELGQPREHFAPSTLFTT